LAQPLMDFRSHSVGPPARTPPARKRLLIQTVGTVVCEAHVCEALLTVLVDRDSKLRIIHETFPLR
jgi:hypothetical protein